MRTSQLGSPSRMGAHRGRLDRLTGARSGLAALALIGLAVSVAACGVPFDTTPQTPPGALPSQLTRTSVGPSETTLPVANGEPASFFFVEDGLIQSFTRKIAKPVGLLEVLQILERGPLNPTQNGRLVGTDIPSNAELLAGTVSKGIAHIGLDSTYYQLANTEEEVLELAQIVYTVQENLPEVKEVLFYDGTQWAAIPNGNGETLQHGGPVDETTYCLETSDGCNEPVHSAGHQAS